MKTRTLKIYYGHHSGNYLKVPVIRLAGLYLEQMDFKIGDKIEVTIEKNQITITKPVKETVAMLPSEAEADSGSSTARNSR